MNETIGPSDKDLGLGSTEDGAPEIETPKKTESVGELVQAVHERFGDDGVMAISALFVEMPEMDEEKPYNTMNVVNNDASRLTDENLSGLISLVQESGGHPRLNRLQWVLDNRNAVQEGEGPWSGPDFPG